MTATAAVHLDYDDSELLQRMRNGEKKTVYVVVNGINNTLLRAQSAIQAHVRQSMMVRKPEFVLRQAAYISPSSFASVPRGQLWGEVAVGQKERLLLAEFEEGGQREPFKGKNMAVAVVGQAARPAWSASVRPDFTFTSLSIVRVRAGKVERTKKGRARRERVRGLGFRAHISRTGLVQFKGARRTFILTHTKQAPLGGVFQRVGPKEDDIRMIYSFRPAAHLDARLKFVPTAMEIANQWLAEEIQRGIVDALQHEAGRA
jgi:hypothetical protein